MSGQLERLRADTAAIALSTILLLWRYKELQEPVMVAAAGLLGLAVYPILHG